MIPDTRSPRLALPTLSRRGFLGAAGAAVGGLALAACAGGAPPQSAAPVVPTGPRTRGGTFRFAPASLSGTTALDPTYLLMSFSVTRAMYDSLVTIDHQCRPQLALAEEITPSPDFSQWTIRLREGVEFHHGKTVDADDVIFTFRRIIDPSNPGFIQGLMEAVDPNGMEKLDARTVRLTLRYPNSQLADGALWQLPAAILPVDFDPDNPVGTGPFRSAEFTPQRRWVGTRNENYWRGDGPYLDRLEQLAFADDSARFNALISGQVDGMDHATPAQVNQVRARPNMRVVTSSTGAFEPVGMNVRPGQPFEDPRMRQAFKLMLDRQEMVNSVYGGQGEVGNDVGVWSRWDPAYPADFAAREQDLDRARALVREAGMENATIAYRVGETVPGVIAAGELMVGYAREIGVNLQLDVVADLAQFYGSTEFQTSAMKNDYYYTVTLFENLAYNWTPNSPFNNTGFDNPAINRLFRESLATTGAAYSDRMREVTQTIYDEGPWLSWGRRDISAVHSDRFVGIQPDEYGMGMNGYSWDEVSLA